MTDTKNPPAYQIGGGTFDKSRRYGNAIFPLEYADEQPPYQDQSDGHREIRFEEESKVLLLRVQGKKRNTRPPDECTATLYGSALLV